MEGTTLAIVSALIGAGIGAIIGFCIAASQMTAYADDQFVRRDEIQ